MAGHLRAAGDVRDDAASVVRALHARISSAGWSPPLRLWDGSELGPDDAGYRIIVHHPWSLRALAPFSERAAGEAFVADAIDVEGSMTAALREVGSVAEASVGPLEGARFARWIRRLPKPPQRRVEHRAVLRGRRHSTRRDASAIRHHYDVGNDFYRLFLDDRMVYSCAYYDDTLAARSAHGPEQLDAALEAAQLRKLELICRKLVLRSGETLLDVGCGWGALAVHAAVHHGVRATGITLSEEQAAVARARADAAGVGDRVDIRVQDYREVAGTFDAVASIGMFEHVGADHLAAYFRVLFDRTATGGRMLNHGITTGSRQVVREVSADPDSFVGSYVFPDGALVPATRAVELCERVGFELGDVEQLRRHYALTLTAWVDRLERRAEQARALVGEARYRIWRAYMAGSVAGFEAGTLGIVQVLGVKGGSVPLDRRHHHVPALA